MIKVDVVKGKDTTKVYFESRGTSTDALEELDELYQIVLGSMVKLGGYVDSNKFQIEVQNDNS